MFTDKESEIYWEIISKINTIDKLKEEEKISKKLLVEQKKKLQKELAEEIEKHKGIPRQVRLESILNTKKYKDEDGNLKLPSGVRWKDLKMSRRIAEFCSEQSRAMGLNHLDITFDKIIVKWKSVDVIRQLILDGFTMPVLTNDGEIIIKKYKFITASAGQLRNDKCQFIEEETWERISPRLENGITWDVINEHGGIVAGKYLAYRALSSSATEVSDIDIDKCIVIPDWEGFRNADVNYLQQDYTIIRNFQDVADNFIDGGGMVLPGVIVSGNAMVRSVGIKGLLTTFDFIEFCKVHNVPPIITDCWGFEHDLIKENIQVIFTASQFKLWNYCDNWQWYKDNFKKNKCNICLTNYEEDWIDDTEFNYQFLQDLDMTDEEINILTEPLLEKIKNIAQDKETMLRVLNADIDSEKSYEQALYLYPELLWDGYSRETLKAIKRRWVFDGKSGNFKGENKRLFVIPDWYAACEYYFLHDENPKGLLQAGEVYASIYRDKDEADICRSPHLSFEHFLAKFNHSTECRKWFRTKGLYISWHDLMSRVCQLDFDGDMNNVITAKVIIDAVKRRYKEFNFAPLYYDANKAPKTMLSQEALFEGVKTAHMFSNIGCYSNMITRLWNKENPDPEAAQMLCAANNYQIDAAKTGFVNSWENYPISKEKISKAMGGKNGRMPFFFQFSKNGRHKPNGRAQKKKNFLKPNNSTMNRICERFSHTPHISMNYSGVAPFNFQMLMSGIDSDTNQEAIDIFCEMDSQSIAELNVEGMFFDDETDNIKSSMKYDILRDLIKDELHERFGSIENVYPSIVKYLFVGENETKQGHKQMFWRLFGDIAVKNIKTNICNCYQCEQCGMKIPNWAHLHNCKKNRIGYFECIDCGELTARTNPKQVRCKECQEKFRRKYKTIKMSEARKKVS